MPKQMYKDLPISNMPNKERVITKGHLFRWSFLLIKCYNFSMSKRYSGKSFKDSSISKKPKLSLKEKRKQKKEKTKKS